MTVGAPWQEVAARLRPFIASRVAPTEVDDVLQDVFVRMQRGLAGLREEERFTSWLFQIARSAVAEHHRAQARAPRPVGVIDDEAAPLTLAPAAPAAAEPPGPGADPDDDRATARLLAGCLAGFVARLPSPYREAVTLVELDGLTTREAAELAGVSLSGMKSRVQRGRAQLRQMLEACCDIAVDARGKVTDFVPRPQPCRGCD
ncbi:MAG: sigma-70 family RNA polymerase sigma factor [Kofleriaceae bacterium]|nr:sigma-70 family RNA polymerase sigma factor [Kofleriaceae bacterium]MBP6840451.1 sigma-70 family RNA polymerase sigma factor [Kofleriaceae bacterium]